MKGRRVELCVCPCATPNTLSPTSSPNERKALLWLSPLTGCVLFSLEKHTKTSPEDTFEREENYKTKHRVNLNFGKGGHK